MKLGLLRSGAGLFMGDSTGHGRDRRLAGGDPDELLHRPQAQQRSRERQTQETEQEPLIGPPAYCPLYQIRTVPTIERLWSNLLESDIGVLQVGSDLRVQIRLKCRLIRRDLPHDSTTAGPPQGTSIPRMAPGHGVDHFQVIKRLGIVG